MIFYEIELSGIPKFVYASNADLRDFKNKFPNELSADILEFGLIEEGRILLTYPNNKSVILAPGMVTTITKDLVCEVTAYNGERQKHISIGANIPYSFTKWDTEKDIDLNALQSRVLQNGRFLVPFGMPANDNENLLRQKMQRILYLYFSNNPADAAYAVSEWFSLLALLTQLTLKELGIENSIHSPAALRYIQKAKIYIQNHHAQKLSIDSVALHVGISSGHLSRLFREEASISVLEYINRFRVKMMLQLIERHKLPLKDAAFAVGFEDPAYASRIFKKITGLSFRQYLAQQKEKVYNMAQLADL